MSHRKLYGFFIIARTAFLDVSDCLHFETGGKALLIFLHLADLVYIFFVIS